MGAPESVLGCCFRQSWNYRMKDSCRATRLTSALSLDQWDSRTRNVCVHAKLLQSRLVLGDPPGSSVHGILQARTDPWDNRTWNLRVSVSSTLVSHWTTSHASSAPHNPQTHILSVGSLFSLSFISGWTSCSVKSLSLGYHNDSPHHHCNHSVIGWACTC